jgi:hypothetical protein
VADSTPRRYGLTPFRRWVLERAIIGKSPFREDDTPKDVDNILWVIKALAQMGLIEVAIRPTKAGIKAAELPTKAEHFGPKSEAAREKIKATQIKPGRILPSKPADSN